MKVVKEKHLLLVPLCAGFLLLLNILLSPTKAEAVLTKYDIPFSISLASASSEYFNWTPTLMGSSTKWTLSVWVKRSSTTGTQNIFSAAAGSYLKIFFNSSGAINMLSSPGVSEVVVDCAGSAASGMNKITTATYTSTSVWYHIVVAMDTTQATAGNRNRLYVDGTEITSFSTDTNISQNHNTCVTRSLNSGGTAVSHQVGRDAAGSNNYFNGLMAEAILVDGKQLTPASFAFTDVSTWTPIEFVGATGTTNGPFGTNGFRLDFANASSLGNDRSGRNNDFTANNTPTQSTDTPTGTLTTGTGAVPSGQTILTDSVTIRGNLSIVYNLSKGSGSFVIDHPLDPLNKLLYHFFVESPDMKNIYDGIAELDGEGKATISLPGYFLALNSDFRYLATPVGKPMPNLHLAKEVRPRWWGWFGTPVFKIGGGAPNGRVSWQVTGIRKDIFALQNPIRVEVKKGPDELVDKGEYLYPELYR